MNFRKYDDDSYDDLDEFYDEYDYDSDSDHPRVKYEIIKLSKEANILTKYTAFIGVNSKTAEKINPDLIPNDEPIEEINDPRWYPLETRRFYAPKVARKSAPACGGRGFPGKAPRKAAPQAAARRGAPSAPGRMMPTRDRKPTPSAFKRLEKKIAESGSQKHMKLLSIANSKGTWTNSKTFWTYIAAFNPKLAKTAVMKVCFDLTLRLRGKNNMF